MIDLQNNKIREVKEKDLQGLTSLYVSLLSSKFEILPSNVKYSDTSKTQMVFFNSNSNQKNSLTPTW